MKSRFDKIFLEYPLICLKYVGDSPERLLDVIEMAVVDKALKSNLTYSLDLTKVKIPDFDKENPVHIKIVAAAKLMNVNLVTIDRAISVWINIKTMKVEYEAKYGTDATCRVGKKLTEDVINGYFGLREYKVFVAIQSILGKQKPYLRITYEQISYRMHGYKRKLIAINEGKNLSVLTPFQIKRSVSKLITKKLVTSVTHSAREKYYSVKIKSAEVLKEMIIKRKIEIGLRNNTKVENGSWLIKLSQDNKYDVSVN